MALLLIRLDIIPEKLLSDSAISNSGDDILNLEHKKEQRISLFNQLMNFFPESMVQPKGDLTDLIVVP